MHESLMINGNYGGDANQLAEALCVHGDTKTQQQAHIDVRAIMHMDSLEDWFGGAAMFKDLSLNRNFTIVAVPLEPGFDLFRSPDRKCTPVYCLKVGLVLLQNAEGKTNRRLPKAQALVAVGR